MPEILRVGILMGGQSAEHEVSLQSAKNVIHAMDQDRYEAVPIGIDKDGSWFLCDPSDFLLHPDDPQTIRLKYIKEERLALVPGSAGHPLVRQRDGRSIGEIHAIFPVLHGPLGEDGTVQGLLRMADVPFVGAGVLGSAVGMDKGVMKRLLREAGLPVARWQVFAWHQKGEIRFEEIQESLDLPLFVKPASMGSSVGIHRVEKPMDLDRAVEDAFRFDVRILIEEEIRGREIECSVLGDETPVASLPGEIVPHHAFYSYEAKYLDREGADLIIPADLSSVVTKHIQELSVKAFQALYCQGMARVDCFLKEDAEVVINEINTIPGFTRISMYPKLWEASGLPYPRLIDRLIQLALVRHHREKALKTSYEGENRD